MPLARRFRQELTMPLIYLGGVNSVATMEMVAYVEDSLNVQFADEVLVQVTTFGDLVKLIENSKK